MSTRCRTVRKWGGYFDTYCSPLNPQNRGYSFFVYGDLPIVVVQYIAEWVGQTGYDQVNLVGRQVSAFADLLTILLIYLIAARLYNRRVALLGAAFSALAVLQIQQSHFFTVDTFANLFIFLAIYFAVEIVVRNGNRKSEIGRLRLPIQLKFRIPNSAFMNYVLRFIKDPLFLLSLGFGVSFGMATASKLDAAPLAILLPGAFILRYLTVDRKSMNDDTVQHSPSVEYWTLLLFT